MARTVACPCGMVMSGKNDEELFAQAREHGDTVHSDRPRMSDEQIKKLIEGHARDAE